LRKAGIKVLDTQINERDAYKALFTFGRMLSGLHPTQVSNLPGAAANAKALMVEVVNLLKEEAAPAPRAAEVA
jgi:chromosome partitioning protein